MTALIPPGQYLMRWTIHEGGLARPNAVWVDDVKLAPVAAVSLDDAAETSGLSLQASGWHGLRHHTAADGSDAIFAGNADGNFLKASMTGPGWLSFNRRPAPESPQWVREQHFIQPGPRQLQWVFPLSSTTEAWAMGMDAMKFSPLQTLPLAEAADNAGPWAGSALGIVDPSPGVIGGSVVMLGKASLKVTGPGIVRFAANGSIRVEIGGTGDYFGDSNRWEEFSQTVPAGPQTITWGTSEALSPGEYLDNVRFEPDHMVPLAEAMDTNLPVQATGGLGLANPSLAYDGVGCAVLRGPGEIRIPVVGPGRLTAWVYSCDVYLDDLEIFGANSGWRFMSVDVDNGPHTVRFLSTYSWLVDRRIDEVSFFPGAAARYADVLGSAPNVLWTYLGRSPPAVQTEGGESVLVSGSPASARMVLYSKAADPWTAKWDLFASAGVIGGFYPEPYALLDEGAYILEHGKWVTKSMYMVARNEAGTSWIDAIIETDRSDGFWKIKAPRGELPSQPGAVSLAEALDSELAWTSTGTGWTAYGAAPWFGGGDAVLGVPTGSALMTEVTGPTFTRLNFKGGFTLTMPRRA